LPIDNSLQARLEDYTSALMTDKIIGVSEEIKEDLRRRLPVSTEKLDIIINGINTSVFKPNGNHKDIDELKKRFHIPQGKKIIGSVGRLEKIKNYRMLIQSFAELIKNQGGIAHLAFVGDGSERDNLENYSRELEISDHISFLGKQYHIEKILPIFDIFTLSSLSEGTSISLLEAQSCGIPAVVTDVGGNSNIVKHGYNGFLCKVNGYKDMAEKLAAVLKNENLRNEMKNHARSVALERFDLSSMVRAYEQLYETLILN
jgi:glycosyltransferase involved in cell wall biosynthesis